MVARVNPRGQGRTHEEAEGSTGGKFTRRRSSGVRLFRDRSGGRRTAYAPFFRADFQQAAAPDDEESGLAMLVGPVPSGQRRLEREITPPPPPRAAPIAEVDRPSRRLPA
ncbi:hypothetical protein KM043_010344 [Ampulex compressa]|nr:hypothetical protein KM043_010344 [Ampulex compressa]